MIGQGGATLQLSWTTNPNLWALTSSNMHHTLAQHMF